MIGKLIVTLANDHGISPGHLEDILIEIKSSHSEDEALSIAGKMLDDEYEEERGAHAGQAQ